MSRNFKKDYLIKLKGIETKNGFKIDLANYLKNPSLDNEYPSLTKAIEETDEYIKFERFHYFKHYDGTGEYIHSTYRMEKDGSTWSIARDMKEETVLESKRFSLKKLQEVCESMGQ